MARKLRTVELYAGIGMSTAPFLRWPKINNPILVDINQYAAEVYRHNHPKAAYVVADLSTMTPTELLKLSGGRVDILLGCPPCQGYSDVGKRQTDDPRNRHVLRFAQFITELKPLAIGMENVPLLAVSPLFDEFVDMIDAMGYLWIASIENAALWGSCQSRQRLIFIAIREDLGAEPQFPKPTHGGDALYFSYRYNKKCKLKDDIIGMLGRTPGTLRASKSLRVRSTDLSGSKSIPTVWEIIGDLPDAHNPQSAKLDHFAWAHSGAVLNRMRQVPEGGRWAGGRDHYSQAYGRLHRAGLSRTITTYFANAGSGRFWHPTENRSLTLREAARIQGFQDSFRFLNKNTRNCTLVGNALDAALSKLTYNVIRRSLE